MSIPFALIDALEGTVVNTIHRATQTLLQRDQAGIFFISLRMDHAAHDHNTTDCRSNRRFLQTRPQAATSTTESLVFLKLKTSYADYLLFNGEKLSPST